MFPDKYEKETDNNINKIMLDLNQQLSYLTHSRSNYTYSRILNKFSKVDGLKHALLFRGFK